ncbi:MAG: DUF4307 domain-containing protein [Cellulosimicrobium funkei]|uniref:DUF4307 domain-containing protein n=1 Tax=Cellulosimicrobium cellulans TaxID=1710 RepID=A0AAV5P9Z6_CELCE|nr:DUF4307 domain-containing protein [Cellulosimicrobium cellulans]QDP76481.1 DUF4307 domain-containing protein [Cellulosimicrobium cellulans]QUB99974.1 DUF4307 domain-containing protein [Cellulosimicrobium cellulans]GLY58011.1 hypothetical protein Ccel01_26130 [Cellulosimicrobium cellulans]
MTNETTAPQPSPSTPLRPPAGRYGPEPTERRRRLAVVGIVLVAVVGLAVTFVIGLRYANEPVRFKDFGYTVVSPERVDVTFEVYMDPGTTATCTLDALAESYAQVGTVDVTVGPVEVTESRYTVSVATSELATTGIVQSCRPAP